MNTLFHDVSFRLSGYRGFAYTSRQAVYYRFFFLNCQEHVARHANPEKIRRRETPFTQDVAKQHIFHAKHGRRQYACYGKAGRRSKVISQVSDGLRPLQNTFFLEISI
ncbi:MAG: hypothetical protein Q4G28_02245, partial [Neisseria sp.]|nr:hypothetical protein [Neisseria sp.]